MKRLRFLLPFLAFAFIIFFFWRGLGNDPNLLPSKLINHPVPIFHGPSLEEGSNVSDSFIRGKITLLNIWASWCTACQVEHPFLMDMSKKMDVQIFGLNYKDDRSLAKNFLKKM